MSKPLIALVGTLDTKGPEYQWVAAQLLANGARVLVVDAGTGEPVGFSGKVDIPNQAVCQLAGSTIEALRLRNDRGSAIATMGEGAAAALSQQLAKQDSSAGSA
jgi:uncharacterized protein (UPF0261 family)